SKIDRTSLFTFAAFNQAANAVNLHFGEERSPDKYQLLALKQQVNKALQPYLAEGQALPSPEDNREIRRGWPAKPDNMYTRIYNFMKTHSVRAGEVGLRFLGAFSLSFPMQNWRKAWEKIHTGQSIRDIVNAAKNSDNPISYHAGLLNM